MADWSTTTARHGTNSGWTLHQRLGERPCDPCFRAKSEYDARRRSAPEQTRKNRMHARAQSRALGRLKALNPELYAQLYAEAKAAIYAEENTGA